MKNIELHYYDNYGKFIKIFNNEKDYVFLRLNMTKKEMEEYANKNKWEFIKH